MRWAIKIGERVPVPPACVLFHQLGCNVFIQYLIFCWSIFGGFNFSGHLKHFWRNFPSIINFPPRNIIAFVRLHDAGTRFSSCFRWLPESTLFEWVRIVIAWSDWACITLLTLVAFSHNPLSLPLFTARFSQCILGWAGLKSLDWVVGRSPLQLGNPLYLFECLIVYFLSNWNPSWCYRLIDLVLHHRAAWLTLVLLMML